ncbi:NucA/NucB deoxyribonuclease domain-containing protein [Streptomyces sp. NPDC015130]|uniref:NucA/NucB deoxyribonuclease domain-containing protein n=1 Tax=Streptomyces sp. NPDC015130 TaxID=3364940 RepID=UPI0036FADA0D
MAALLGQPSAGATEGVETTEMFPTVPYTVDEEHPILNIGDRVPVDTIAMNGSRRGEPVLATQTEHGDAIAQRTGTSYDVNIDDFKDGAPAPRAALSYDPINDCRSLLGGNEGARVINHFQYCSVKKQAFHWVDSTGKIAGTVSYVQTTAGQAPQDYREIYFQTNLGYFDIVGYSKDMPFEVVGVTGGYSGSDGSNPKCDIINSANNPKTLEQWRANGSAVAVSVFDQDKSLAVGRDFVSRCTVATVTAPGVLNYKDAETGIRLDSASYLEGTVGSGIFDRVMPNVTYYLYDSPHGPVALHIHNALNNPEFTVPYVANKSVPGGTKDRPLTRLYPSWDSAAKIQRQKNISAKDNACAPIKPPTGTDQDCDEFPFGSTWEGPAAGPNFSVRYLGTAPNRSAGATLGNWYTKDRILHKDKFIVKIVR